MSGSRLHLARLHCALGGRLSNRTHHCESSGQFYLRALQIRKCEIVLTVLQRFKRRRAAIFYDGLAASQA